MKWQCKPLTVVLLLMSLAPPRHTAAQDAPDPARNTVYSEVSTVLLAGAVSANYERILLPWLSARAGVGAAYVFLFTSGGVTGGVLGMLMFHTSANDHKFEAGLGLSKLTSPVSSTDPGLYPALTIGYRYQRATGGLFFRAGANWSYGYGFPFQVSVGHTF